MRRGFTLAELLITLGIIAVISALLAASIVKLKPDSDKATFLKQYDAVMNITNKIVNNSRLYPICQNDVAGEEKWDCRQHPLFNIAQTSVDGKSVNGTGKYCDLLAMSLSGKKLSDNSCSLNPTYADGAWTPTFTTKNGSEWLVSTSRSAAGDADSGYSASYQTEVYFDLNGAEGPNCLYNKDSCKKPDRFKLLVAADGTTIVADPMGQAYVNTRKNWNKKTPEIADDAVVVANLNVNLKDFALQRCGAQEASPGCPDGQVLGDDGICRDSHPCPDGFVWNENWKTCMFDPKCPDGQTWNFMEGKCKPVTPGCGPNEFPFYDVPAWDNGCYPPGILIQNHPIFEGDRLSLVDWNFHVWTNSVTSGDIVVFLGLLNGNYQEPRDVIFEIGCMIPSGGRECALKITNDTPEYGVGPAGQGVGQGVGEGVDVGPDYRPGGKYYNDKPIYLPCNNNAAAQCIEESLRKELGSNYKNYKINAPSNNNSARLMNYGTVNTIVKVISNENQKRDIHAYSDWLGGRSDSSGGNVPMSLPIQKIYKFAQ